MRIIDKIKRKIGFHVHEWVEIERFQLKINEVTRYSTDAKICYVKHEGCKCFKHRIIVVDHEYGDGRDHGGMGLEGISYECRNPKCNHERFVMGNQCE